MRILWLALMIFWAALPAAGHEIRPALLELVEVEPETFQVTWKQPAANGRRLALSPVLPDNCERLTDDEARLIEGGLATLWQVACPLKEGIIQIEGLDRTLTDVFIEVRYLDGDFKRAVVRPGEEGLQVSSASTEAAPAYLRLGVEHILSGPDHLLFVIGLLLLTRLRKLLLVITAFTLAHSLTLGLTAIGWISLAPAPVELMIAVSIVLIAVEALRLMGGTPSLTATRPWLVSFGFGLLHGFGFAGALGEIGLPTGAELSALLFFNIGVEIGQLLFIGIIFVFTFILMRIFGDRTRHLQRVAAYGVGVSGTFWVLERLASLLIP